jgi:hypothetical protein
MARLTNHKVISVGDLVQIVRARACCAEHTGWGHVFRVKKIETDDYACHYCKKDVGIMTVAWGEGLSGAEISRLKRIPPLDEIESWDENFKLDHREPA